MKDQTPRSLRQVQACQEQRLDRQPIWRLLVQSRKFWIALVAVAQSILFELVPDFPSQVWMAIDGLAITLIATIAYEDGQAKRGSQT